MLDLLIITGASRGIGANIAKECSNICQDMIIIGSSDKILETNIPNAVPLQFDLHHFNSLRARVNGIIANKFLNVKSIGIVLCASQIGQHGGLESNLQDWHDQYACNVLGNLAVVQACEPWLKSKIKLRVAFFAGGGGAYGYPEFSGYALTKVATVRAVENLGMEFDNLGYDASIIAVAPGAVATDMLTTVKAHGGVIKTQTDISEPTNFVRKFLIDEFPSREMNGKFLHVRDDLNKINAQPDIFKLRRIQ
jgi:NAD(P)-dependent dehydrogenase (short-subunit alcohol dehydrogenase family)